MKKIIFAVCAALIVLSCTKEMAQVSVGSPNNLDTQSLVFDFQINHTDLNNTDTKAVKRGWEAGDKVYVFFSTIEAPKHVEMTYDGSTWSAKEIKTGTTEGSIGLAEEGLMTAVYMPFSNDAVVRSSSGGFSFDQTNFSYYLSCVNVPYTLSGGIVSGTLNMNVPDGFVQFFFTDANADDSGALLREAHITPKAVTGVNPDGTLIIASKEIGTQMTGFAYGTGDEKGYLFSGVLADAARGVSTDYRFNMVVGDVSKILEGTKTLHGGTAGNYTHRAFKFPALSTWANGDDEIIEFADANVKAKVVAAFDKNGDGELSYSEAALPSSISYAFDSTKDYTYFNEFQYFTGIKSIPYGQFKNWSLKTIVLPKSVTKIGGSAFSYCEGLQSVNIPSGISSIEMDTFYKCSSLKTLEIPDGVTSIGSGAFQGCSGLVLLEIPEGVTSIGNYTFSGCSSLTSLEIPYGVTSIGKSAFSMCTSLTSLKIPSGVTSIEERTFHSCSSLTSLEIPDGVTSIGSGAFQGCNGLVSLKIPEEVTSIGNYTFSGCSSLTSLEIPKAVTNIGDYAFYDCSKLEFISFLSTDVPIGGKEMFSLTRNCPIYVPAEYVEAYKAAENWERYAYRIEPILPGGDDADVINNVKAKFTGGSIISIDGVIQMNSKLNYLIYNNSCKMVKVMTVQLVDGVTGRMSDTMYVDSEIAPSSNSGWTITVGAGGIQSPVANFVFSCDGKRYEVSAPYKEINIP